MPARIFSLPSRKKRAILLIADISAFTIAFLFAIYLRYSVEGLLVLWPVFIDIFVVSILAQVFGMWVWRLYHQIWRYASVNEILRLTKAMVSATLIVIVYIFFFHNDRTFSASVLIIDWMLAFILVGSSRVVIRLLRDQIQKDVGFGHAMRALIVGAGDAGEIVARELIKFRDKGVIPIGFCDDDTQKQKFRIHGIPVLGVIENIPEIVRINEIEEIIIAIPSAKGATMRRIIDLCRESGVPYKITPGLYEIFDGRVSVSQVRNVQIEDLLGRDVVEVDTQGIATEVEGKTVLITGAGGSIGSELARQIAIFNPARLLILGKGENSIFYIERELIQRFPFLGIVPIIADVKDPRKIESVLAKYHPNMIFHAAAHKHVPLMESNNDEAITNNILGTKNLIDLSQKYEVSRFVMISTDKAVNPTSVMGMTKRMAECYLQAVAQKGAKTKFAAVRFGNVLGSRGSVVPLFKEQIQSGGPITVTHPDITRYFMTIPEASRLVIQAGIMAQGGEIYILDMGEPVKIKDLAEDLIRLSGFTVGEGGIEIKYTGLRPGEKLYEELYTTKENIENTNSPKIFKVHPTVIELREIENRIKSLENIIKKGDSARIKEALKEALL